MIQDIFNQIHLTSDELCQYINQFISSCNKHSKSTLKTHQIALNQFHSYFTEKNNFSFLVEDVKKYQKYLQKNKNMQQHSVKTYISSLRRFCNFLVKSGVLEKNPVKRIKLKSQAKNDSLEFLNYNQILSLINSIDSSTSDGLRDRTILSLILFTHITEYEITALNYEDVQLYRKKWYINIRKTDKSDNEIIKVPHPASNELHLYMNKYDPKLHDGHPLFFSFSNRSKNRRLSIRGIRVIAERRMANCELINNSGAKLTISILRNTSAIILAKNSESIQYLMNRFKIKHKPTAEKYYHYIDKL